MQLVIFSIVLAVTLYIISQQAFTLFQEETTETETCVKNPNQAHCYVEKSCEEDPYQTKCESGAGAGETTEPADEATEHPDPTAIYDEELSMPIFDQVQSGNLCMNHVPAPGLQAITVFENSSRFDEYLARECQCAAICTGFFYTMQPQADNYIASVNFCTGMTEGTQDKGDAYYFKTNYKTPDETVCSGGQPQTPLPTQPVNTADPLANIPTVSEMYPYMGDVGEGKYCQTPMHLEVDSDPDAMVKCSAQYRSRPDAWYEYDDAYHLAQGTSDQAESTYVANEYAHHITNVYPEEEEMGEHKWGGNWKDSDGTQYGYATHFCHWWYNGDWHQNSPSARVCEMNEYSKYYMKEDNMGRAHWAHARMGCDSGSDLGVARRDSELGRISGDVSVEEAALTKGAEECEQDPDCHGFIWQPGKDQLFKCAAPVGTTPVTYGYPFFDPDAPIRHYAKADDKPMPGHCLGLSGNVNEGPMVFTVFNATWEDTHWEYTYTEHTDHFTVIDKLQQMFASYYQAFIDPESQSAPSLVYNKFQYNEDMEATSAIVAADVNGTFMILELDFTTGKPKCISGHRLLTDVPDDLTSTVSAEYGITPTRSFSLPSLGSGNQTPPGGRGGRRGLQTSFTM
jgi:hypothetical protein